MKKLLLLLVAACFLIGANAQKAIDAVEVNQVKIILDNEQSAVTTVERTIPPEALNPPADLESLVEKIYIGEAHSQRSFRREDCRVIAYNEELDLISVSFILDQETYPGIALSNGSVGIFYSTDHGQTWDGPVLLSDVSGDGLRNYYLSGSVYNPTGNTVVEDAYGVYQGIAPDDPALAVWNAQVFGTSTLGGANYFTEYFVNSEPDHEHDGYFNQMGLIQIEDYMKCFNIWAEGEWAGFTALKMEDIQGTFNGTGIDWDLEHSVVDMPFNIDGTGEAMWVGKWTWSDLGADMLWSDDGMIGYTWMVGAHENMETGYWPMMFRTDDGGNTWDEVLLDFFDEDIQAVFSNGEEDPTKWLIFPCQDINEEFKDFAIPRFLASAGAVDAEGNLQLFADVGSHSRDFINEWEYYEGIGWSYLRTGCIFKFTIGEELIDAMLVDSLMSVQAQDQLANDSLYLDNGWLHRLHVTKDERSEEFFVTWNDSPEGNRFVYNFEPDIKGWSYNITTGEHTDPVCFTCGETLPFEHYWFVSAADYAYYNPDDTTFTVPMLNAIGLDDFYSNSNASADPIEISYVTDITFDAIVPISVGVNEFSKESTISVSQNLPNPATGITAIRISSENVAPVSIEISNITGQSVQTIDAGIINGKMSVNIDVSNFEAGVYFYTVTIADERISKRMIVR